MPGICFSLASTGLRVVHYMTLALALAGIAAVPVRAASHAQFDIVADFGGIGLWARMNDAGWLKLHNGSPTKVAVGDLDANGQDDVIAQFDGIFVKRNLGGWVKLHNFNPEILTIGDLDGNGQDDVVIDFGGIGLWARMNDSSWLKLHNASPGQLVIGDMDGNGADDLVAVYASGVFVKRNLGGWSQLHNFTPQTLASGDLDNSGQDDIIIDFGAIGLWARMNDASWFKLHNTSPLQVTSGDIDGNGADDVFATFAGQGLWQKLNLGGWSKLSNSAPDAFLTGDVDGSGQQDIIADFASTLGGIFVKRNQGAWVKLHNSAPESLAVGDLDGASGGTLSGSIAKGTIMAVGGSGSIVAVDNTAGRAFDTDSDGDGFADAYSFSLGGIPLNENVRVYIVNDALIASMFYDFTGDNVADTNVFRLSSAVDVDLGFVLVERNGSIQGPGLKVAAFPQQAPTATLNVSAGTVNLVVPIGAGVPPTAGLSVAELNTRGLNALRDGWVTGARTYFEAATSAAGGGVSNDADTARFFLAIVRVAGIAFDTPSDGDAADMNRAGDLLDRFGAANDETRASPIQVDDPGTLAGDSPSGNALRDFLYNVAGAELQAALANLAQVSSSFNMNWTEPFGDEIVETDSGDVRFYEGMFAAELSWIAIQRAYDLDADVDAIVNARRDADLANDVTVETFLADGANSVFLGLTDSAKLTEARTHLLAALDALDAAIDTISAETDSQLDDFIVLDSLTVTDTTARDYLADVKNAILAMDNRIDRNDQDVTNDMLLALDRVFGIGVDFRGSGLLPVFNGNAVGGLFPDPTFSGVVLAPDLNEDIAPADGIPDVAQ